MHQLSDIICTFVTCIHIQDMLTVIEMFSYLCYGAVDAVDRLPSAVSTEHSKNPVISRPPGILPRQFVSLSCPYSI